MMPMTSTTVIMARSPAASESSRANWRRTPTEGREAMMTNSTPAIKERQAKAQPCFSPATIAGRAAGMTT